MANPFPIRSPLNKENTNKDYSYTSPLRSDGSDYPCKGYHKDPFKPTAQYKAGGEYSIEIVGGASHGGGSCQVSLSYDAGQTFKAIKSFIGSCPLTKRYKFTIPSNAPSGNALLAWTWFNRLGNREMYMNCAHITISGSSGSPAGNSKMALSGQATALQGLPNIFLANINQPSQCKTDQSKDVVFPFPGHAVEYGSGTKGAAEKGYVCSGKFEAPEPAPPSLPPTQPPALPSSETTSTPSSTATTTCVCPPAVVSSTQDTPKLPLSTSTATRKGTKVCRRPTASKPSAPPLYPTSLSAEPSNSTSCIPGDIKCESDSSFLLCSGPVLGYIKIEPMAGKFRCLNDSIQITKSAASSTSTLPYD
ncbi:putative DNA-directed RNA polymerase [Microsporum ferrugineum]